MITADLAGKRVLVTGGASGIGLATVELMARLGARVAVNYLPDDQNGPLAIDRLKQTGLEVIGVAGNVGDPAGAETMVKRAIDGLAGLDYLVNNAGTAGVTEPVPPSDLDAMTEDLWQLLLNVNLVGQFRCAKAAAEALKASSGAIVNTASTAGLGKQGSSTAYAASKAALVSLTRSLARGLGPNVRVNAVAPAQVRTPWTEKWSDERKRWTADQSVLKQISEPEDIAEAILYLCAGARNVTGHVLTIDGGLMLN